MALLLAWLAWFYFKPKKLRSKTNVKTLVLLLIVTENNANFLRYHEVKQYKFV